MRKTSLLTSLSTKFFLASDLEWPDRQEFVKATTVLIAFPTRAIFDFAIKVALHWLESQSNESISSYLRTRVCRRSLLHVVSSTLALTLCILLLIKAA